MNKRRVTLNLDEDVVAFLKEGDESMSATANAVLREGLEGEAHRRALSRWLDELDERHGRATPEEQAEISEFLDEVFGPEPKANPASVA